MGYDENVRRVWHENKRFLAEIRMFLLAVKCAELCRMRIVNWRNQISIDSLRYMILWGQPARCERSKLALNLILLKEVFILGTQLLVHCAFYICPIVHCALPVAHCKYSVLRTLTMYVHIYSAAKSKKDTSLTEAEKCKVYTKAK